MRKKMASIITVILVVGLYSTASMAQIFTLKVTDYGLTSGSLGYSTFKTFVDTEIAKIQDQINGDLPSAAPARLMEGMANSSVMAGKGIGTDYASNMKVFLIGAGVGVGADLAKTQTSVDSSSSSNKDSISGVGVAPGVIVGMNLGFMDTKRILGMDTDRLNLFMNFMSYGLSKQISDKTGEESSAKLDMLAMGMHFRYDWIKGRGSKLLGWGGVKFTFGYEYNKTDISFNSKLNKSVNETSSSNETISGTITGNPIATINSATHSIPLALSTDIQLLYFLSLYVGAGVDYNFGQAKGKGNLNADESTLSCTGGNCTAAGNPSVKVQAAADLDATGKVNPFLYRGFAGVQFNLPYLRIFGQVDKSLGNDLIGATAGVRLAF